MNSGIYIIHNTKTGQVYIGQAQNIPKRWKTHITALDKSDHANRPLQAAWNKYGASAFKFKVLEYCDLDQLDARENHYLAVYMAKGFCYNIRPASSAGKPKKRKQTKPNSTLRQIWVRSDPEFMERLNRAAAASGMAKHDFVRMVMTDQLRKLGAEI